VSHKTKKQHFVPQFLLRNFVADSGKIWAYDKSADRSFISNTEGVACDGYFYDDPQIAHVTGEEQFVEKALSKAEGMWAKALSQVLERIRVRQPVDLSHQERMDLSQMMALQMVRTPLVRQDHDQMMHALIRVMNKHGATDDQLAKSTPPIPTAPEDWDTKGFHISSMLQHKSIRTYQAIFASHIWWFLRAAGHGAFYTSDHPLARRPHIKGGWISHAGIASPGIEIAFPLAQDVLLVMFERSYFLPLATVDGRADDITCPENVLYYNSMQVQSSLRWLYSANNDFTHAKLVCEAEPIFKNPNRKLVKISGDEE
jgi:hypothetical protein